MEDKQHPSPADVADAFVKQFYVILNQCPENLHKFYQESSLQGWAEADGSLRPVTTLSVSILLLAAKCKIRFFMVDFVPLNINNALDLIL